MAESCTFHMLPAEVADAPVMAKIGSDAFLTDRQTQMKNLGRKPYDLEGIGHDHNLQRLTLPERCRQIKAVDSTSGEIIGFCAWIFRCFSQDEAQRFCGDSVAEIQRQERVKQEALLALAERNRLAAEAKNKENLREMSWTNYTEANKDGSDPIIRLEKLTSADFEKWQAILEPPNTKCICVSGFSVKPAFQNRGVGRALITVMGEIADRAGVHCWVHSSEDAWKAYASAGFEVVGTLRVDLDEYSPAPPPDWYECGEESKWGHYLFRYMKRNPVTTESLT